MSVASPSAFERLHFDSAPVAVVDRAGLDLERLLGYPISDEDVIHLSGAPAGALIQCEVKTSWTLAEIGSDRPDIGLYFRVSHPWIPRYNHIGLGVVSDPNGLPYFRMYLKDVSFVSGVAPTGIAGSMVARVARRCLKLGITSMRMLAAGGRLWGDRPTGQRWTGYYAWVRYGFDMPLGQEDIVLFGSFPYFPPHLTGHPPCKTAQDVVKTDDGLAWWRMCGNGHFMEFDCSNAFSSSIALLDNTLASKGI